MMRSPELSFRHSPPSEAASGRPAKAVTCRECGEQRPNAGHDLCNRCKLTDPDWPFRYGASLASRLPESRALAAFFASCGLMMPGDQASRRAAARRQRFLDAVPRKLAGPPDGG